MAETGKAVDYSVGTEPVKPPHPPIPGHTEGGKEEGGEDRLPKTLLVFGLGTWCYGSLNVSRSIT